MRSISRQWPSTLLVFGILAVSLVGATPSDAHRGYGLDSLEGRWAFVEEFDDQGTYGTAVGIYRFDGAGGCTVQRWENQGAGLTSAKGACSYELKSSGLGFIESDLIDLSFAVSDHGRAIEYIHADRTPAGKGYFGHGEMAPTSRGFTERDLNGRWSFAEQYVMGSPGAAVGRVTFDGEGECTEKWTEHGGLAAGGPSRGVVAKCTYTIDRSGRGTIAGGFVDQHFVIVGNSGAIWFIDAEEQLPAYRGLGELRKM